MSYEQELPNSKVTTRGGRVAAAGVITALAYVALALLVNPILGLDDVGPS
jgi:hypothetical protein